VKYPNRIFSIFLLTLLVGCGGGDDPVTPEPVIPPLVSATIGEGGGELATPEIILTVPAGVLADDADLSIHADGISDPFETDMPVYRLEGLPEELGQPVTLRIRHGGAKSDAPIIFLGEERESYESGRGLVWFNVATRDSSGWCIAELDRGAYVLDEEKHTVDMKLVVQLGLQRSPTSGGHFEIYYHPERTTAGQVALIAAHFEQAWNSVTELGFNFGGANIWPRPVLVWDIPTHGRLAQYTVAPYGKGYFQLDPDALVNSVAMGVIIGHEVLHCAQDHFDTRPPSKWKTLNVQRLWLDEATASWFEEKFYPGDDSYPLAMDEYLYLAPLNMFAGTRGGSWAEMGYGLSSLIKYVVERQGEQRILEFYEEFTDVGNGTTAFLEVVDPAMDTWVVDYFHELVTGNIYSFLEPGDRMDSGSPVFPLVGGESDLHNESWKLWEMGARLSYFTVSDERNDPAPDLKITPKPGGPIQVSLYGLNEGQHPVLIETAADSLRAEDLPGLCDEYEQFMALGVRIDDFVPDEAEAQYRDPTFVLQDDDLARFETAEVRFRYKGYYASGYVDPRMFFEIEVDLGRVGNHVYHAEWDSLSSDGSVHSSGHFTVDINPLTMEIQSFSAASYRFRLSDLWLNTLVISGTSLPLDSILPDQIKWAIPDASACGSVTGLTVERYIDEDFDDGLMSFECNEESSLYLFLRDDK
jgi:hypothetical protein